MAIIVQGICTGNTAEMTRTVRRESCIIIDDSSKQQEIKLYIYIYTQDNIKEGIKPASENFLSAEVYQMYNNGQRIEVPSDINGTNIYAFEDAIFVLMDHLNLFEAKDERLRLLHCIDNSLRIIFKLDNVVDFG